MAGWGVQLPGSTHNWSHIISTDDMILSSSSRQHLELMSADIAGLSTKGFMINVSKLGWISNKPEHDGTSIHARHQGGGPPLLAVKNTDNKMQFLGCMVALRRMSIGQT